MSNEHEVEATVENTDTITDIELVNKEEIVLGQSNLSLEKLMEMATVLSKSTILPISYQNRPENCFIMLDVANRTGMSPLVVAQNLYVVQGKPSWAGQAIASMIRTSRKFKDVELVYIGTEGKDDWGAYITATDVKSGRKLKGATITIEIAKKEGWYQKNGSKWQTIPELMLTYRAYAFFGRQHAPEIMMGLHSAEEVEDVAVPETKVVNPYEKK